MEADSLINVLELCSFLGGRLLDVNRTAFNVYGFAAMGRSCEMASSVV